MSHSLIHMHKIEDSNYFQILMLRRRRHRAAPPVSHAEETR